MANVQVFPLRYSIIDTAADTDDRELVRRTMEGDRAAFECLVKRTERAVTSVVSRIMDSPDDIADVVQDVYLAAYRDLPSYRGDSKFSTWIYRIALHLALKQRKKSRRRDHISLDDEDNGPGEIPDANAEAPDASAIKRAQADEILRAVSKLSEKHRAVVILHHYQNLSCEEIAKILNCPTGTVWSRLHHAYKNLRRSLRWLEE